MIAQHTPGPWGLAIGKANAAIYTGGTIAIVDDTMTAWRANAHLIATAPTMLALLSEAVARVQDLIDGNPNAAEDLAAWSDDARATITKAEGRT
jgi:hypothetical protein